MSYVFDGVAKTIILSDGITVLDVMDCYSRWKEWVAASDNSKYLPAFDVVGGNPTVGNNSISSYFFLLNGWKIRPQESNHTLTVSGILIAEGGADPFANTVGNFRVRIVQVVPLQAEQITVYSGGGSSNITPSAIANAVWSHGVALDLAEKISIAQAILQNKTITDPSKGTMVVYAEDGVTPLLTATLFEDSGGSVPYRGQGAEYRGRLT